MGGLVQQSLDNFRKAHEAEVSVEQVKSLIEFAKEVQSNVQFRCIILEQKLAPEEINYLIDVYSKIRKSKPAILLNQENFEKLNGKLKQVDVFSTNEDFTPDIVYKFFSEKLKSTAKKFNILIIQEILLSVVGIIKDNTGEAMKSEAISEVKLTDSHQEISAVIGFIGEGIIGNLSIGTSEKVIKSFTQKMLYCEEGDVTPEMISDVYNELSNQIFGAFRNKLNELGFNLKTSMQIVASSASDHLLQSKIGERYYNLKFRIFEEEFNITFAYTSYVMDNLKLDAALMINRYCLDIRLVNFVTRSINSTLALDGVKPKRLKVCNQKSEDYRSSSIHLIHCRGPEGSYILALDMPKDTLLHYANKTMGMMESDVTPEVMNDICGEYLNQMNGYIKKASKALGYEFLNVFHGGFCCEPDLAYLLKNPGLYIRLEHSIEDKPFTVCFGMESAYASEIFDAWPYLKGQSSFQ